MKEHIPVPASVPRHIAIIMDGNGRWAQEQGQNRLFGHFHGVGSVRNIVEGAAEAGVEYLTLYAFSTENWDRPQQEVDGLMELLVDTIKKEVPTLNKNNIRLHVIGELNMLPAATKTEMQSAIADTAANTGMNLIMALSYSSKWELMRAIKNIAQDAVDGKVDPAGIDDNMIKSYLATAEFPDPELMIRTGGDFRISNFLLYQLAYTELFFSPKMWPDFRKPDLYAAIEEFNSRERRFGKTGEQVQRQPPVKP